MTRACSQNMDFVRVDLLPLGTIGVAHGNDLMTVNDI